MNKVTSRIKTIFSEELLHHIAALCDTKRIPSNNQKMIILGDLLYTYGCEFEILGGATNRIALQIDGYAVKFAMDHQGYQDNLVEYSLSQELQPYVTKSYETNGYIQIQECVEVMTKDMFRMQRPAIYTILDTMMPDYLLGDVGYIEKNRTNWGMRGGQPVILDYAYCHRLSEELFICEKCGLPLTYDGNYDKIVCPDGSGCKATYTYNERKMIQGNKIDDDMIRERKAESIKLEKGEVSKDIELVNNKIVGDNYFIIDSPADMYRYNKLKEEADMKLVINGGDEDMTTLDERLSAIIDLAKNPDDAKAKEILKSPEDDVPEAIYTDNYQENYMYSNGLGIPVYTHLGDEDDEYDDSEDDDNEACLSLSDIISMARDVEDDDEVLDKIEPESVLSEKIEEPDDTEDDSEEINKPLESFEIVVNGEESSDVDVVDSEPEATEEQVEVQDSPESANTIKNESKSNSNISVATIIVNGKEIGEGEEIEV